MDSLLCFLDELEKHKIYCRIIKIRDIIRVEIAVPKDWREAEFFTDEEIQVEKIRSNEEIRNSSDRQLA